MNPDLIPSTHTPDPLLKTPRSAAVFSGTGTGRGSKPAEAFGCLFYTLISAHNGSHHFQTASTQRHSATFGTRLGSSGGRGGEGKRHIEAGVLAQ